MIALDTDLQQLVMEELDFDPKVRVSDIGVRVKEGIVSLEGTVETPLQRHAAEKAAERVTGVKGIVNELRVQPAEQGVPRSDEAIAHDLVHALEMNYAVPAKQLKVVVDSGWVTLEGSVDWKHEAIEAERTARRIRGVIGISSQIQVQSRPLPIEVKARIADAFRRSAEIDAGTIVVDVKGHQVVLCGKVRSWAEMQEAGRVAWSVPGVTAVENDIAIAP